MRANLLPRALIAVLCLGPVVDVYVTLYALNLEHLDDPTWPIHARFHLIWALITPVIVGLAAGYIVVRHWQQLAGPVRAALCVVISAWYLGEAIDYFLISPWYFDADPITHASAYVGVPFLKVVVLIQAVLGLAVGVAYLLDRRLNPAPSR